jgi:hypothetical protein
MVRLHTLSRDWEHVRLYGTTTNHNFVIEFLPMARFPFFQSFRKVSGGPENIPKASAKSFVDCLSQRVKIHYKYRFVLDFATFTSSIVTAMVVRIYLVNIEIPIVVPAEG